jgi:hypothetical protein
MSNQIDSPDRKVLDAPWTYKIVGLAFRCGATDHSTSELDLALSKENESVRVRFRGVHGLEIDNGFPWAGSGLQILDASARGMEEARVRVRGIGQDAGIRFWARSVERMND